MISSNFSDAFASSVERQSKAPFLLAQLYQVLAEPTIASFVKTLDGLNRLPLNESLFLTNSGIFTLETKEVNDRFVGVPVRIDPLARNNRASLNELIAVSGLTPEKLREIIRKNTEGPQPLARAVAIEHWLQSSALSLLNHPPSYRQEFSEAFSRLGLRHYFDHLSNSNGFEIKNPAYFELPERPSNRPMIQGYFKNLINRAASELGPSFYVKSPESILSYQVIKAEILTDGGGYRFSYPRRSGSHTFKSIEDASKYLSRLTGSFRTLLVEAEIPGLTYMLRPIELRVLVNSSHDIVGHYVKNGASWITGRKMGLDTTTVLTRSLALTCWNYRKARDIASEGLNRLASAFGFLKENQIQYTEAQQNLLASVDLIPVYNKEMDKLDWFLLESEAPRPETNRRIGIQGLYSVSPAMHNRAIRYLNTYS
jgi:hypothetical protein